MRRVLSSSPLHYHLQLVTFRATVENDLMDTETKLETDLSVRVATGGNWASTAETDPHSDLLLDGDFFSQWLTDPLSPSQPSTSSLTFTTQSTISSEPSKQEDISALPFFSPLPVQDATDMKRTATDLEDTFSTWKGKGKAEDDVDAEATRNTGRSRSGSLSLYRPATIATPEAVTSTFLKENQTVSGSNDPTTSIHQDSGQVLGKRRASTDLFEENYSAVASDHSFHALQDYNNLFPAVQGDMYPPYTSLLNQHDGTADVVPYQALPPAVGHTLSSNIGSFNNAAYVPSTGFDIPLKGEVEGPSISQHPSPMPPRAHSDYHGHVNEVPLTQRWLNPHLYYRNDANYDYASPGMSQPNDARLNGPPNVHAQPSYFNNGNGAVHAQSSQNYHIYGNGTSRDGIAVSQYPTAPGRPQPNNAHNGSVYHPQSPHKHGMGSQAPRHFRGLQYGFNMTPTTVYPTHAQHHAVGQNVDNAHQAPSNVVLAPRSPAIKRVESTAPSSNSTVSTPGSSSSGSSRSQSDEPEEILFVTEDVVCQWVISGPGEPIQTCDRLMKPDENPADHVRQFHSPEYRQGTHEWYCKWLTCQKWTTAALKRHMEADSHTKMGRRVCPRCGGSEPRFERIVKDHTNCEPGVKLKKKRKVRA